MHNKSFNKCFGERNIRAYVLFLICKFVLSCLYVYQIVYLGPDWKNVKSNGFIFNMLEIHMISIMEMRYLEFAPLICAEIFMLF